MRDSAASLVRGLGLSCYGTDAGFDLPEEHGKREQPSEPKQGEKTENKAAASLDAELAQAMQSLGTVGTQLTSFWGSFRKTVRLSCYTDCFSDGLSEHNGL